MLYEALLPFRYRSWLNSIQAQAEKWPSVCDELNPSNQVRELFIRRGFDEAGILRNADKTGVKSILYCFRKSSGVEIDNLTI